MKLIKDLFNEGKEDISVNEMRKICHFNSMAIIKAQPNWEKYFLTHYQSLYDNEMIKLKRKVKFVNGRVCFDVIKN